jgi:hypothetical protein
MKTEEFVEELRKMPLDTKVLRTQGVSEGYIQKLINSYQLKKKAQSVYSGDPVLELIENYDSSNLEIGMISFDQNIEEGEDYLFFGKFEVDDLAVHRNFGTVVMLEDGSDHVLYKCAGNGAKFLDALILAAKFLEKRANDDSLYENQGLTCKMAEECGEIAGGKAEYQDFYKMMFGCDE